MTFLGLLGQFGVGQTELEQDRFQDSEQVSGDGGTFFLLLPSYPTLYSMLLPQHPPIFGILRWTGVNRIVVSMVILFLVNGVFFSTF